MSPCHSDFTIMEDDFQEEDLEAPSVNFDTEIPDALGDSNDDTPMTSSYKLTFHVENNPEPVTDMESDGDQSQLPRERNRADFPLLPRCKGLNVYAQKKKKKKTFTLEVCICLLILSLVHFMKCWQRGRWLFSDPDPMCESRNSKMGYFLKTYFGAPSPFTRFVFGALHHSTPTPKRIVFLCFETIIKMPFFFYYSNTFLPHGICRVLYLI